jgi:ribonucleotide monophosphatase NagD (HAD superfamily)
VDFDGTIWDGKQIIPGCTLVLAALRETYEVAIYSARQSIAERNQMEYCLKVHFVPYDVILPPKPEAVAYIDDKAIHFDGWDKVSL